MFKKKCIYYKYLICIIHYSFSFSGYYFFLHWYGTIILYYLFGFRQYFLRISVTDGNKIK